MVHTKKILFSVVLIVALHVESGEGIISVDPVATGLTLPVAITHAGDGSGRLFITLQTGRIAIFNGTQVLPAPFLDINPLISCCGERGLLSAAFHPDYANNGFFYVNYTNTAGDTVIARYSVSANPDMADPNSSLILLTIPQPFSNHNGGQMQFGPDGFLYIGTGDGGSGGDPQNNAQNLGTLLGKILRIDVDSGAAYAVPADNPFIGIPGARDEIWSFGLRNPWRFSFDRLTGDLFIADVGQNSWEELNFQRANSSGGENYGWRLMEGNHCFDPPSDCNDGTLTLPVLEYDHSQGCSITGGYRYRGTEIPKLSGIYLYGDFCSGRIWGAIKNGSSWKAIELLDTNFSISSFGEDEAGELYFSDYSQNSGTLYRIRSLVHCDIQMNQTVYTDGDTVSVQVFRLANKGPDTPVEWKVWLGVPAAPPISLINIGADGSFVVPAGFDQDFGPFDLAPASDLQVGSYELSCRMLDPVTGELLSEDRNQFAKQ